MAISATTTGKSVFGNKRIAWGTASLASGDTRGSIACPFVIDYANIGGRDYAAGAFCTYTTSTIDATFSDPTATKYLNWFAMGH